MLTALSGAAQTDAAGEVPWWLKLIVFFASRAAQAGSNGGTPWWLTLLVALIALSGAILSAILVRRSSRDSNAIAEMGAHLVRRSATEATQTTRLGQIETRLAAVELDEWRRREETMRMLRWAAESAASDSQTLANIGLAALGALGESELLQPMDEVFIDRVLDAILASAIDEYNGAADTGDVEVVLDATEE